MPFCRVCRENKGVFEFPDDVAGEADICISCAHDHAEREKAVRQSASKAAGEPAVKSTPVKNGMSAARIQKAIDRVRALEAESAPAPQLPPKERNAPLSRTQPDGGSTRKAAPSQNIAQELMHAVEQHVEAMRQQLEREVRAKLEAELAAAHHPQAVGFRVIAFDDHDRPLPYGRVRAALDTVEATLRKHGFPPLATAWSAWLNGAWITAKPSVADEIVEALEKANIPGVEVFSGYPEDFFLNAVPL